MTFRFPLLLAAAAAFLMLGTGCESNKTKAEINSLMSQNKDLQAKLDAESAARQAAETKAQLSADAAARAAQAPPAPVMAAEPGQSMVDLRGGTAGRMGHGGAGGATVVPVSSAVESPSHKGTQAVLEIKGDVLFDSGKATIKVSAEKELDALAATIRKQYAGKSLRIEGHTDASPLKSTSKYKSNTELGEARAKAVMAYLAKKGVPSKEMTAVSLGSSQPKSTKDQSLNRRVDIVVAKDAM